MAPFLIGILAVPGLALSGLHLWRRSDRRADRTAWRRLAATARPALATFDPATVGQLPEPARRYFGYTIAPGTPLHRVMEIDMSGEIGLGTRARPGYRAMQARQILAAPHGLVWRLRAGAIGGSDAALPEISWTRFWLFGLLPVVRVGGTPDHRRSAFGRVVAEAAFWSPAALLPGPDVSWAAAGRDTARATVSAHGLSQSVDISVAADGRPETVLISRWSNANSDRRFRLQPFGGTLADFRQVGGFRLPFSVDGGNHFGTSDYFPFYRARVLAIRPVSAP